MGQDGIGDRYTVLLLLSPQSHYINCIIRFGLTKPEDSTPPLAGVAQQVPPTMLSDSSSDRQ